MMTLTTLIAACPVCAAGARADSASSIWPLMLIAPFAIAAIAGLALWWLRRRAR